MRRCKHHSLGADGACLSCGAACSLVDVQDGVLCLDRACPLHGFPRTETRTSASYSYAITDSVLPTVPWSDTGEKFESIEEALIDALDRVAGECFDAADGYDADSTATVDVSDAAGMIVRSMKITLNFESWTRSAVIAAARAGRLPRRWTASRSLITPRPGQSRRMLRHDGYIVRPGRIYLDDDGVCHVDAVRDGELVRVRLPDRVWAKIERDGIRAAARNGRLTWSMVRSGRYR